MSQESIIPFPGDGKSSLEKIWGKKVKDHGYVAIPTIMIRCQHRLGISSTQFCILLQLLEYYRLPGRHPFPTKQQLADRIGIRASSVKLNMNALVKAGLVNRVQRKTSSGDWGPNTYELTGLIHRIQQLEPEFAEEKLKKEANRRLVEVPNARRKLG